jgi:hypothetical protein
MDKVAIGRLVLTNREHIIALEPLDIGRKHSPSVGRPLSSSSQTFVAAPA